MSLAPMEKTKSHAFRKDCYLLGRDKETGEKYWLEEAKWECEGYWAFGYVETYTTNDNPAKARDIESHQHFDGLWFKQESREYYHKLSDRPNFESVLSEAEEWKLGELMRTFYTLKESAEVFGRGGSHVAHMESEAAIVTRKEYAKEINEVILPPLFKLVYAILAPTMKE